MKDIATTIGDLLTAQYDADNASSIEKITNGTFETGDFTGWTHSVDYQTLKTSEVYHSDITYTVHAGNYGCKLVRHADQSSGVNGLATQTFLYPLLASRIIALDFWYTTGVNGSAAYVVLNFGTDGNSTVSLPVQTSWTHKDLMSSIAAAMGSLGAGISLTSIEFHNDNYTYFRIDDVSLKYRAIPKVTYDEFDQREPNFQVLIENLPNRRTFFKFGLNKIIHRVRITVWVKPVRYDETVGIPEAKTLFTSMKNDVDTVLDLYKFSATDIASMTPMGWNDLDSLRVGRGTKGYNEGTLSRTLRYLEGKGRKTEPIEFYSQQIVSCTYYEDVN